MRYEYKFVEIERSAVRASARTQYQDAIREHAEAGWRLVQIFAPGDSFGSPQYAEMIFERPEAERPV